MFWKSYGRRPVSNLAFITQLWQGSGMWGGCAEILEDDWEILKYINNALANLPNKDISESLRQIVCAKKYTPKEWALFRHQNNRQPPLQLHDFPFFVFPNGRPHHWQRARLSNPSSVDTILPHASGYPKLLPWRMERNVRLLEQIKGVLHCPYSWIVERLWER